MQENASDSEELEQAGEAGRKDTWKEKEKKKEVY